MIYQTVNEFDFVRAFDDANRSANFSREARRVLFEYYEDLSDDMGEDIELDPIGICCEWAEYTARELLEQYGDDVRIYRYIIDLDERGEFRSRLEQVDPLEHLTGEGLPHGECHELTGDDFAEGGTMDGIDPHDEFAVVAAIMPESDNVVVLTGDEYSVEFDRLKAELNDRAILLTVEHIGEPDTYLFRE